MYPVLSVQLHSGMDLLQRRLTVCFPLLPSMWDIKLNSFVHIQIH